MEININVDELKFKEILQKELEAFSKEELHDICRDGLVKCMNNPETFKDLFTYNRDQRYYNDTVVANDLLKTAAKNVNLSPCFKELEEKAIKYISENAQDIIIDIMKEMVISGIEQRFYYSDKFRYRVKEILSQSNNPS